MVMVVLRRLARQEEIVLHMMEQRLIGRRPFMCAGLVVLGIRMIRVWLISFTDQLSLRTPRQTRVNKSPKVSQCCWKKHAGKPSIPGALWGGMLKRVLRISSGSNGC